MIIVRECIINMVGWPQQVIKPRYIAMVSLIYSKETQKISRGLAGGGGAFPFPKGSIQVVSFWRMQHAHRHQKLEPVHQDGGDPKLILDPGL